MRLLRTAVALGAVLAVLAAPVSAAPATRGDSVGGVGVRLSDNRVQYTVSVMGGPNGPTGSFLYRSIDFSLTFGGRATCFDIAGNHAAIGGWITHVQSRDPGNRGLLGQAYLVFFEDNGSPARGQAGPDVVSQTYILPADAGSVEVPGTFPADCPDAAATEHDAFDVSGNFVVSDR
jgi:hypothetical protein